MSALHVARAARILRARGIVAYPTEGVYGLGCLPRARFAVARLLALKRRSWRKGLLLVAADVSQLEPWIVLPSGPRGAEILATWPGPVTWVLEARRSVPRWIRGRHGTVGVRVSAHPLVQALCRRVGSALVSTSANLSRRPPARRALAVRRAFAPKIDYVLAGPLGGAGAPTVIRDGATGRVLRPG